MFHRRQPKFVIRGKSVCKAETGRRLPFLTPSYQTPAQSGGIGRYCITHFCIIRQNSKPKTAEQSTGQSPECAQEQCEKPQARTRDSLTSSSTVDMDICRICHCEAEPDMPLISPCVCSGSLAYVHQSCLQRWIKSSDTKKCELCKYEFIMESKMKPINKVR